jgi:hypothetical protein
LLAIRFPQDGIKLVNNDRYFIVGIGHLHPNATDLKDAHEVTVAAGRQTDWEAESVREGVAKLSGVVDDPEWVDTYLGRF